MKMFKQLTEEVIKANKTSRKWKKTVVSNIIRDYIKPTDSILDFGAGKHAVQAQQLKDEGYNVTAYDFGNNLIDGVHDEYALSRTYDVIYCSNVLNVQSSPEMMNNTLKQINRSLKTKGKVIANYTKTPRYMDISQQELVENFLNHFFSSIIKIGGGAQYPIWLMTNEKI